MNQAEVLALTRARLQKGAANGGSQHDIGHIERVTQLALQIGRAEGADLFVVELAALLHAPLGAKPPYQSEAAPRAARAWLTGLAVADAVIAEVETIARHLATQEEGQAAPLCTLAGQTVQDADRLDAIGAIGIARVFAFGGALGCPLHDPAASAGLLSRPAIPVTSINRCLQELLTLHQRLHTSTAQKLAAPRHAYLERFLQAFHADWGEGS